MRRVSKRNNRPLLKGGDPQTVMQNLMDVRYPVYAQADITVESRDVPHDVIVAEIIELLSRPLPSAARREEGPMTSVSESHAETRASVRSVQVPLGDRAYEVLIGPGLLAKAGELIAARLGAPRCGS